jgi:YfiH family protein
MEPFNPPVMEGEQAGQLILDNGDKGAGVTAGFTTRHAGNTALHVGDDAAAVVERRRRIADRIGWNFTAWTCAEQVHGNSVHLVRQQDAGRGSVDRGSAIADTDAIITDESDILLVQYFADCVPLYFIDPVTGALGLAHAGWKGTVADIARETVRRMTETYGTNPADVKAAVGPSIGGCCYEVDEAVIRHIRPIAETEGVLTPAGNGRARLDLKELNRHLMIKAGILPSRIEISRWCTGCRTDLFFSHRKENGSTGRMMSWLGRKSR